jgi:hypothetical protein
MKTLQFLLASVVLLASAMGATPAKEQTAKPKYELPKTGVNLRRPAGGWLNAEPVDTRLVIKFFDKKKKPVAPDVETGFVRFRYIGKRPEHAVMNIEGDTLVTPATVRPPHNFFIILNLFDEDTEQPETYSFKYP